MENFEQNQDVNEVALRAKQLTDMGRSLNPTYQDLNLAAEAPQQQSYMDYFAAHPGEKLDLNDPNTEATWKKIVQESSDRVTNYGEVFGQAVKDMAMLPVTLAQGIKESPNPLVWAGSTIEGVGRMYRDMIHLLTSSENPTSPIFHVRAAATSLVTGKSRDWRAEVAQWNDARETNYNTHLMEQGQEVLLDRFINLSPQERENIKGYINPKIAHAMGFIGLELPAIGRALMTSGAESAIAASASGLAIEEGASKAGSFFSKTKTRFENASGKLFQGAAAGVFKTAGKILEYPAAMVQGLIGANIERAAGGLGVTDAVIRNAAETAVGVTGEAAAAGGVKRTVGYLGSLGIRTNAEVMGAYGEELANAAKGVIPRSQIGLTTLERLAQNPNLSPTGKMVAKFLNVTVDPVLQLSTAALKEGYVGALEFGFLGYLNDRDKGALSGAAMGLVWSGYSGAFRHSWSIINGGFSHRLLIDQFDGNVLPQIEKYNPTASAKIRTILEAQDKFGNERASANNRNSWDGLFRLLDPTEQRNAIIAFEDKDLQNQLQNKGVNGYQNAKIGGKASFDVVTNAKGEKVPIITMTPDIVRGADVAHEIFSHAALYAIEGKQKTSTYHSDFFGTKKDGGILPDAVMIKAWAQRRGAEYYSSKAAMRQYKTATGKEAFNKDTGFTPEYKKWSIEKDSLNVEPELIKSFEGWLGEIRKDYPNKTDYLRENLYKNYPDPRLDPDFKEEDFNSQMHPGARWMFEEICGQHMEGLYMFSNFRDIMLSDSEKPLRYYFERARNDLFAKKHLELNKAGVRVTSSGIFAPDGTPKVQLEVYDDGKWQKHPGMDEFAKRLIREAINLDNNTIYRLSPERMAVEAKKHGKEYMFNPVAGGVTMKGEKELNEISDSMSKKTFETIKNLPDNLKVEISVDEHGNEAVDLTHLSDGAFDAIVRDGGMDQTTANHAKAIRDVIRSYYDSGFTTPNIMVSDYWAAEKEITRGGVLSRLQGKDVPITHRMFVPYELRISNKIADANGKPLSKTRTTMTVTAVDYMAIHNNKITTWSRPDVRKLFTSIDEMNVAFDKYVINMMQDPSVRVPSEELFRAKYGANSAKVRDVMYNIFNAVKRGDEGFINSPGEEARINKRGPNFPYHSLRLDRMVNLELTSSKPFAYHHGNSYEGFRRNLSTEGFERITNTRYRDRQGYEIFVKGGNFKVYSPFGQEIDVVDSFKRAAKVAGKHFKKLDDADKVPSPDGFNSEAFFGGGADVAEQKRVRDKLNEYLSNFDSRGRMLQCRGLDDKGNVVGIDTEIDFGKFKAFSEDKDHYWKKYRTGDLLSSKTQRELTAAIWVRGVQRSYNVNSIPVLAFKDSVGTGKGKAMRASGYDLDDISALGFSEAEYLDQLRRENKIVRAEISHHGPVFVVDANSPLLHGLNDAEREWVINQHFAEAFDDAFNGSRPDSQRSPISQSPITATTPTYGKANLAFDFKVFHGLKNQTDFKLVESTRVKKLRDYFQTRINSPDWLELRALGDANDKLLHDLITETAKFLDSNGTYYTHPDSEGKPATILLLDEKHKELASFFLEQIYSCNEIVQGSEIAKKILKKASGTIDHQNIQTLIGANGVFPFNDVTVVFGSSKKPLMMVKPSFLSDGEHNAYFVQQTDKHVIVHGSSIISVIAGSDNGKNDRGGRGGDATKVAEKGETETLENQKFQTKYETGVTKSISTEDYFKLPFTEQVKFFDTTISDGIRDINVTDKFLDSRAHLTYVEILLNHYSPELDLSKDASFMAIRDAAKLDGSSVQTQIKYLRTIERVAIKQRNSQAYRAAIASINLLESNLILYGVNDIPPLAKKLNITNFADVNNRFQKSQFNNSFFNLVGIGSKKEPAKIYDLINSANENPNFKHDPEALKELSKYANKATPYGELGTQSAMQSVVGFERPINESEESFVKRMEATGLVRVVGNGQNNTKYVLFELPDNNATFTSKNQGRLELTPFIKLDEPQKAFDDYMNQYGNKPSSGKYVGPKDVTLGDIFDHEELYKHFPEMKDIPVKFVDRLGASAVQSYDGVSWEPMYHIEFGIRNLINSGELAYPSYLYRNEFIKQNPATSMMLHEVQHILQYKFDHQKNYTFNGPKERAMLRKNFLRYLGAKDADLDLKKIESDYDPHQVIQGFIQEINNSPVYKNLNAHVKPLFKTYIGRLSGALCELADAGLVSPDLANKSLELINKVDTINSPTDANLVYESFENLLMSTQGDPEVQLRLLPMHDDFHAAGHALELHSALDPQNFGIDQPNVYKIVSLRRAVDAFAKANYFTSPTEIQARVTEKRRTLNRKQLFEQPRQDVPEEGSTLELVKRISNSSNIIQVENFNGSQLFSVGDLKGGEDASDVTKKLGKLSLVSYIALKGSSEFQKLGRFLITQNGWEVDKDGKLVLTKKTYTVRGDFDKFYQTQKEAEKAGIYDETHDTGSPVGFSYAFGQYGVIRGSTEGLQATYTIDDILALSNATIEAEHGLSVGNSVVDNVLNDRFPPMIKGTNIIETLNKSGFSHTPEAFQLSGVEQISMAIGDGYVTKADLANLIMYYHNSLDISNVSGGEMGTLPSRKALDISDFEKYPRERIIAAAKDTVFPQVTGRLGLEQFYRTYTTSIDFGVYSLNGKDLKFEFIKPDWVPDDVYEKIINKHLNSESYKNLQKRYLDNDNNGSISSLAHKLNERIQRKLLLIEPVVQEMLKDVKKQREANAMSDDAYNAFIVGLFDKMVTDALVIQPNQFLQSGGKPKGPFFGNFNTGREGNTVPSSLTTNVIKRRGLTNTIQGVGGTYEGLTVKGSEYGAFGFHTPVPMIGAAWFGTPFDFNEVASINTSWFGTRIHPQGDVVPFGPSAESVGPQFSQSGGKLGSRFNYYFRNLDSVNSSLAKYETLHECAMNLFSGYQDKIGEAMMHIEDLEGYVRLHETDPQKYMAKFNLTPEEASVRLQKQREQIESLKRSVVNDNYEQQMAGILKNLFALGNQRFLHDVVRDNSPSSGVYLRKNVVGGSRQEHIAFAPQYGVQTYQIGGKTIFDLDHIFCSLEDKDSLEIRSGFGSGIPLSIRKKQADASLLFDGQLRLMMFANHDYWESDGNTNDKRLASVTPTERHLPLFNLLTQISSDNGASSRFDLPKNMTIASGKSIVEIGLLGHAVRLGRNKGIQYSKLITDMVTNKSLDAMQDKTGYLNNTANWSGLGTNFNGVEFLGGEMSQNLNLSVQHQSLGVASSVVLRHLLVRNSVFTDKTNVVYGTLPGIDTAAYRQAEIAGLAGEFSVPFSQLSPDNLALINDFINQLPQKTKAFIVSELSSTNNSLNVLTSLGVINSLKLIKKQQENPAAFKGTVRHPIHPDYNIPNGLSLQDAVDYSVSNSLHTKVATIKEGERANLGVVEHKEIHTIMAQLVDSPEFWHGYFAAHEAHNEIMVPNMETPYSFLDRRHKQSIIGRTRHSIYSNHDFRIEDNAADLASRRGTYLNDVINNGPFLRFSTTLEHDRYTNEIHGFSQSSTIDLNSMHLGNLPSEGVPLRKAFSNEDPTSSLPAASDSVLHGGVESTDPITLNEYFYNASKINRSTEIPGNIDYSENITISDGSSKMGMTEDNGELLHTSASGSDRVKVRLPIVKTNIGKSLRDDIIRHQLALSARQYGATEISSIAARYPISVSVPTLFPGLTEVGKIDYLRNNHVATALIGMTTQTSDIVGRNDLPRSGLSWTRLEDGRLMINYTPTIDLNQLFKMINREQQMGIPFKTGLGFDTASGTLIPQSSARMLWMSKRLSLMTNRTGHPDTARLLNGSIHFDQQITNQQAKAFRALSGNVPEGDPLSAQIKYHTDEGVAEIGPGRDDLAALLNPDEPVMFGLTPESMTDFTDKDAYRPYHHQFLMDAMSQHNNHTFSYFTHVLPKDCTKEDVNAVIIALHSIAHELNPADQTGDEMGFNSTIHSIGFNRFTHQESSNFRSMYKTNIAAWKKRELPRESKPSMGLNPELENTDNSGKTIAYNQAVLRKLASTNPDFAAHVDEMSSRAVLEPRGYSVPSAERKLKLNGDRSEAIKLMFPGRNDLLKYAWDAGKTLNLDVFEKSDKSGFIVSHDSITGMNADGTPEMGRKAKTFKTRAEADTYSTSVQNQGGIAGIPNVLFGDNGYRVEKLSLPEAKGESAVNVDITPVVSLVPDTEGNARTTISKTLYKVGNLDGIYPKKQAVELAKMLKAQDVITAKAPEVKRSIMLSTDGLESAAELERLVRARSSFGITGSPFSFSSTLMKAITLGALSRDKSVEAYTGNDWFRILKANGVSKGEMRATGVASMLHNLKDHKLSRNEFAQFAAAMYPTFYQTIDRGDIRQTNTEARIPRRITDPQAAINRVVSEHSQAIGEIESSLISKIDAEQNPLAKQVYSTILDNIRNTMITSLGQIYGFEKTAKLFENKNEPVGKIIAGLKWDPNGESGIPDITAGAFWLFRNNLSKSYSDVTLSNLANSIGIDLKEFELTTDNFNHTRTDNAIEPVIGQDGHTLPIPPSREAGEAQLVGAYGYGVTNTTVFRGYSSGYGDPNVVILHGGFQDSVEIQKIDNFVKNLKAKLKETTDPVEKDKLNKMIESANNVKSVKKSFNAKDRLRDITSNHQHFRWMRSGIWEIGHLRFTSGVSTLVSSIGDGPLALSDAFSKSLAEQEIVPTLILEETQSDKYQKMEFGKIETSQVLPSTQEEAVQFQRLPEFSRLTTAIEAAKNKRQDLIRETRVLNKPGMWNDAILGASIMKARMQQAHVATKYALLKSYENITSGETWKMNTATAPKELLQGLLVKTGRKVKIPKEVQDRFGLPAEIEDFYINDNHLYANWLYKELSEGYLSDDTGTYFGSNPQKNLVKQLFGEKIPYIDIPLDSDDYYGGTRSFRSDSQGLLTLKFLKTASMFDENLAATMPRIISDVETKESLFGVNYDFDALGKRAIQILETKLLSMDRGEAGAVHPKGRAFLGRVIADLKAMAEMDGRKMIMPEKRIEKISEQSDGWVGGEQRYDNASNLAELATMEGLTKPRMFVLSDITECFDRSITSRTWDDLYSNPDKFSGMVKKLMENKKISHGIGDATYPTSAKATVRLSYIEALKLQMEINAANHNMSLDEYLASSKHELMDSYKAAMGLNGPDAMIPAWNKILGKAATGDHILFSALTAPTDMNDASESGTRIAPPAAKLSSRTVIGRYLEVTFPSIINAYKSKKFIEEQNLNVQKLEDIKKEMKVDIITEQAQKNKTMPDVLPLGEEGAYRGVQSAFSIMKAIQERQEAVSYIDGRYHINRYGNNGNIKIMYNLGNGRGGFIQDAGVNDLAAIYTLNESQKIGANHDFLGRIMRGELKDSDIRPDGLFVHGGQMGSLKTHVDLAINEIANQLLVFDKDHEAKMKECAFEMVKRAVMRSKNDPNMDTAIVDAFGQSDLARVQKVHKGSTSLIVAVPYGRFNGYSSNYGLPSWAADIVLSGQSEAARTKVKHDLYTRPVVEHKNGVFNILDPKTGKLLVGDLTDPRMVKERVAQLSKYEGSVPVVSSWLGTYKRAGMYFMNSHLWNNTDVSTGRTTGMTSALDNLGTQILSGEPGVDPISNTYNSMMRNIGHTPLTADLYRKTEGIIERHPNINTKESQAVQVANVPTHDQGANRHSGFYGPAVNGTSQNIPEIRQDLPAALYAMGVRKTSSAKEIAAAIAQTTGFVAPAFIVRPRFPTEAHTFEMRKMVVEGIPLMSVGDFKNPNIKAKRAVGDYKWLTRYKPIPLKRNQDDDETTIR